MDDLSHLPPEVAGQLRVALARWHRIFEGADIEEEMDATAEVGFLTIQLIHLQAHEMARLAEERRRARWTTVIAVAALVLALALVVQGLG